MDTDTPFPQREDAEETCTLTNEYKKLFNTVLAYTRERVMRPVPATASECVGGRPWRCCES